MNFIAWFASRCFSEHIGRALFAMIPSLMLAGFIFSYLKQGELLAGVIGALLVIPFLGVLPQDEGGVVWLNVRPMAFFIGTILFCVLSVRAFNQSRLNDPQSKE